MASDENTTDNHDEPGLPDELVRALRAEERPLDLLTARVDREIRARAATQFSRRRERRPALAAAAAVLVAVTAGWFVAIGPGPELRDDFDGSGRVDIADVLALARSGQASAAEIDALAMRIVALDNGEES